MFFCPSCLAFVFLASHRGHPSKHLCPCFHQKRHFTAVTCASEWTAFFFFFFGAFALLLLSFCFRHHNCKVPELLFRLFLFILLGKSAATITVAEEVFCDVFPAVCWPVSF
uniref:Uncharacterized protein n=1 Tax=Ixodes ricinus TaxID=34613 RepID=A0A147BBJ0_IXORI